MFAESRVMEELRDCMLETLSGRVRCVPMGTRKQSVTKLMQPLGGEDSLSMAVRT